MKKLLKILGALVILAIVLCVVLAVIFAKKIDTNGVKQQISAWVHTKTGRDLTIAGDIQPSFFPWIGLKVHDVHLSNAKGFVPQDFISFGQADVKVKLLPLIKGQIEIGKITLQDATLNLSKDMQGRGNWQDLTGRNRSPVSLAAAPAVIKSELKNQPHAWNISLATIELHNASVNWVDMQHRQQIQINHLQLKSKNIAENKKFPLAIAFDLTSNQPQIAGKFTIDSNVTVDLTQQLYAFNNFKFVGLFDKLPKLEFYASDILANMKQYQLSVPKIRLSYGAIKANANLNMTQLMARPLFNGGIYTSSFNVKDFLQDFGIKVVTKDPKALQQVMINTSFNGTPDKLYFNPLTLDLDGSEVTGYLTVGTAAIKSVNFALKAQQINMDRYLPAANAASPQTASTQPVAPATTGATQAATPATVVTVATSAAPQGKFTVLPKIKLNGSLTLGDLTVANTNFKNFYTQLFINNGILQANPLTADVYQGKTRGQVAIDFRGNVPAYTIDENLSNIQVNELTKSERLTGRANIDAHLGMRGADANSLLSTLDGHLKFAVQNGALLGIDVPFQINRALALVRKEALPAEQSVDTKKTDFGVFTGSGNFDHGVFSNNDLLMQSSQFKLTGNGQVNLLSQSIDYHVNVVGLSQDKATQGMERQLKIPLLITGSLAHPVVTPDLQAIAGILLKEKIVDKIEKFKENAGSHPDELKRKAGELLKRFLH